MINKLINDYLLIKEGAMETVTAGKTENATKNGEQPKKKGFGEKFMNFLAYGGFLVILIGGGALVILISWLFNK